MSRSRISARKTTVVNVSRATAIFTLSFDGFLRCGDCSINMARATVTGKRIVGCHLQNSSLDIEHLTWKKGEHIR